MSTRRAKVETLARGRSLGAFFKATARRLPFSTLVEVAGRRLPAFIALAVLGFHLAAIAVYLGPDESLLKQRFGRAAYNYVEPLFYQNWHLFSPNPGVRSNRMLFRCHSPGQTSGWLDPMASARDAFAVNRLNGVGRVLNIQHSVADDLLKFIVEKGKTCNCSMEEAIRRFARESPQLPPILRYGARVCSELGRSPDAVDLRIVVLSPIPYSERDKPHDSPWGKVETYDFPAGAGQG